MRPGISLHAFAVIVACVAACASESPPQSREQAIAQFEIASAGTEPEPCATPESRSFEPGDTIVLDRVGRFPCRAVAVPTGIQLLPSDDGTHPDPQWTSVVIDSRGYIYSAARRGDGNILAWNPDGSFLATVGRRGGGPGELSSTTGRIVIAPGDTFVVLHSSRVSFFGPDRQFVREMTGAPISATRGGLHITDDGRFISGGRVNGAPPESRAHIASPVGELLVSVGTVLEDDERIASGLDRPVAYGGGETFWTLVIPPERGAYLLEEWSLDGDLVRALRRTAPWLERQPATEEFIPGGTPYIEGIHMDAESRIWIPMLVMKPDAGSIDLEVMQDEEVQRAFEVRFEVVDTRAADVLVSGLLEEVPQEGSADAAPLALYVPRTSLSYRNVIDPATGLERIEFFALRLTMRL